MTDRKEIVGLTPRHMQVVELVAQGLHNREIAERIGISQRTVEDYVAVAAGRLPGRTKPRHKLTVWFLQMGRDDE